MKTPHEAIHIIIGMIVCVLQLLGFETMALALLQLCMYVVFTRPSTGVNQEGKYEILAC
jgi:hypothetical protein